MRLVYQGTTTDLLAKLVSSLGSGQVPAVALMSEVDTQRLIDSGGFVPMQDFVDRDGYDLSDLDQRAVKYFTVQDELWAMPYAANVPLLYYNKTMFREVGLDPERPPQDLEELRSDSEKILQRDASGQVTRSGIALDIRLWTDMILAEHGDFLVNNDNGRDGRATEARLRQRHHSLVLQLVARHGERRDLHSTRAATPHSSIPSWPWPAGAQPWP